MNNLTFSISFIILTTICRAQSVSPNLKTISIEKDEDYSGYELIEPGDNQLFVLAERWHNIRLVPRATMKLLKYLHKEANVRVLAIEQGNSAAYMINRYLSNGDTVILRQIARNTMFWGQENWAFFQDLYEFNQSISESERVSVQSIDIEYKMESAIFVINELINNREIPATLINTVGTFYQLFEDNRFHREQFEGLAIMYYYDKELVTNLVRYTLADMREQKEVYKKYFGDDFNQFATTIKEMDEGLIFDYTNPNTNYKFRDRLIQKKFMDLLTNHSDKGILCVIGMRHATKGSSLFKLNAEAESPVNNKVMNIRICGLYNKAFRTSDLKRINFTYPGQLRDNDATLIKHDMSDPTLRSKLLDYTLFINNGESLTPFKNTLKEGY
ncbi:MAG: erythromycin esterase family protein [Cyclobacteriaceae bacterium]